MRIAPVTVIVPCWNYGMFLRECLDSILAQTVLPEQIIIADDCSSDNSPAIYQEYLDGEHRPDGQRVPIRVVRNAGRLGTIKNENSAGALVETPWMFFLDADDKIDPTYIEKAFAIIDSRDDKLAIVYSDMRKFGLWDGDWVVSDWNPDALRQGNYINGHSFVRTDLFREIGMLKDGPGFEDHQMWVDILDLNKGYYGVRIPESLVWYRRHEYGHRTDKTDIAKRS